MKWTKERPSKPGQYWIKIWNKILSIHLAQISGYQDLITDWDGGASINDETFRGAEFYGPVYDFKPQEKCNDKELSLEDELKELEKISSFMHMGKANNFIRCVLTQTWIKDPENCQITQTT